MACDVTDLSFMSEGMGVGRLSVCDAGLFVLVVSCWKKHGKPHIRGGTI